MDSKSLRASFCASGSPENPAIVFLHGIRLGRHIWDEHVRVLADRFQVLTLDLPGHGALLDFALTQETADRQLRYIIEDVLQRPPVIVAYSLGGYIAMSFIQQHPAHTSGLVLAGATIDVTGWKQTLYEVMLAAAFTIDRGTFMRLLSNLLFCTLPREVAQTIISTPFNHDVFAQSRSMISGVRFSEKLCGYPHPGLFLTGQFDVVFRPEQARFARACGAQSRVIKWTDHVFPLRRPYQFSQLVADFCLGTPNALGHSVRTL
ncbi:MAG: alpha/beta hydrolase [Candidatus Eremiobacteraeota bacterium]|nr:alpha/beta hydrolase [Candidatus Eremiobacteraeota bacterium]